MRSRTRSSGGWAWTFALTRTGPTTGSRRLGATPTADMPRSGRPPKPTLAATHAAAPCPAWTPLPQNSSRCHWPRRRHSRHARKRPLPGLRPPCSLGVRRPDAPRPETARPRPWRRLEGPDVGNVARPNDAQPERRQGRENRSRGGWRFGPADGRRGLPSCGRCSRSAGWSCWPRPF